MLHHTLRRAGDHAAHGDHHKAAVLNIERQAHYTTYNNLGLVHHHNEPNYRKKPAGWAAFNNPKLIDPMEAFPFQTPIRHVDRTGAGMWFGMGHFNPKMFSHWQGFWRFHFWGIAGSLTWMMVYARKMSLNGWQQKNRGAVFGTD